MTPLPNIKTPDRKTLIRVVIVAAVIIIVIFLLRKKAKADPQKTMIQQARDQVKEVQLTFEKVQYSIFCDKIEGATTDFGTDEDMIYSVFDQMQNDSDVNQLVAAFGTRKYWGNFWPANLTLTETLYQELDESEIQHINSILLKKGIKFRL